MSLTSHFYDPLIDSFFNTNLVRDLVPSTEDLSSSSSSSQLMRPKMDLYGSKDSNQMTATFEVPGLTKSDIDIDIQNNRLIVSGQHTTEESRDDNEFAIRERRTGRFSRTLPLPGGTKSDQINAKLDNGILTVNFPKSSSDTQPKRIKIT